MPMQTEMLQLTERVTIGVIFILINYEDDYKTWPLPIQGLLLLSHLAIAQIEYSATHDVDYRKVYLNLCFTQFRKFKFWVYLACIFDISAILRQIDFISHDRHSRVVYWQLVLLLLLFIPNVIRTGNLVARYEMSSRTVREHPEQETSSSFG